MLKSRRREHEEEQEQRVRHEPALLSPGTEPRPCEDTRTRWRLTDLGEVMAGSSCLVH